MNDYKERKYLSSIEVAKYLGITVQTLHGLVKQRKTKSIVAASSQKRFNIRDLKDFEKKKLKTTQKKQKRTPKETVLNINDTSHRICIRNAMDMKELKDNSVHLMVTSPPYF